MLFCIVGRGDETKMDENSELSSLNLLWNGRANSSSTLTAWKTVRRRLMLQNSHRSSVQLEQQAANAASTLPSPSVSSSMLHELSSISLISAFHPDFYRPRPLRLHPPGLPDVSFCPSAAAAPVVLLPLARPLQLNLHPLPAGSPAALSQTVEDQDPSSSC